MSLFVFHGTPDHKEYLEARFPKHGTQKIFEFKGALFRYSHTQLSEEGKEFDVLLRPGESLPASIDEVHADNKLRDEFAKAALVASLSHLQNQVVLGSGTAEGIKQIAEDCYLMADAMLLARDASAGIELEKLVADRDKLLSVVKLIPLGVHPANENDDFRPCVCSQCNLAIEAKAVLEGRDAS